MRERLARAWRALVNEPTIPQRQGEIVILTGPLPHWIYMVYLAEAERQQRDIADVIYQALHRQASAIIRQQGVRTQ